MGRALLTGLVLIILCVALVPYRYLVVGHPIGLLLRFFPLYLVLILAALLLLSREMLVPLWKTDSLIASIFLVLAVDMLSAFGGIQPYQSIGKVIYFFVTGPIIYILVRWTINEYPHTKVILLWFVSASSALAAIYGISEFLVGENWLFGAYFDLDNSIYAAMVGQAIFVDRIMGTIGHPVVFAAFLLLTFPVSISLAQYYRGIKRWLGIFASLLVLCALFLTLSRGAWIGLLAAVLFYCIYRNKRLLIIIFLGLGILGGVMAKSRTPSYEEFIQKFRNNPRVIAYSYVAQILPQRIYLGNGVGTYRFLARSMGSHLDTPDNMYLMRLAEAGLIGLATWGFLFMRVIAALRINKNEPTHIGLDEVFSILLLAGLIGFFIDMLTFDALYIPVTRIMFWMLLGIGCSWTSSENLER